MQAQRTTTREQALRRRLLTQRLASAPLASAADAVRLLTCVQSQERDHAFFSLGMRARRATYASVKAEYDSSAFLRTHILRPTWHFVAPEDLRWILAVTSPRVIAGMTGRHRQLGLDTPRFLARALDALCELLRGGNQLTRREIGEAFARGRGLPAPGAQLGHVLLLAELHGLICSGAMRGVHHSYALTDEVVPRAGEVDREQARVRLVHRFFAGHGPASIREFTRWSSLTVAETRAALAELGPALERVEIDGVEHWLDPAPVPRRARGAPGAYLFPVYDEAVLTYTAARWPRAAAHPAGAATDPFWAPVLADDMDIGLWKRTVRASEVEVTLKLAPAVSEAQRVAVDEACARLAAFLGRDLARA